MKVIEVSARKGGVGTSAVACGIAISIANEYPALRVALVDTSRFGDCVGLLGVSNIGPNESTTTPGFGITVIRTGEDKTCDLSPYDVAVVDAGITLAVGLYDGEYAYTVGVVRNEYLSLRAEVGSGVRPNVTVVGVIADRALTYRDAQYVLGSQTDTHEWAVTPEVSRAIDAGMYEARSNSLGFVHWARDLFSELLGSPVKN